MFYRNLLSLSFSITLASAQTCYWRNGGAQENTRYQPCSNDTSDLLSHICCKDLDTCLPNGICQAGPDLYFRESCTLSNWEAGGCQDLCSSVAEQRKNDVTVTPCDHTNTSEWWCCGDSDACCTDPNLEKYRVDPVFLGSVTSSSLPSSTSASIPPGSSSSSSSSNPSPTRIPPNNDSDGLSTGAKAGIGVGAAFGVIALIALGVFIGRRSHKKRKEIREETSYYEPAKEALPPAYRHEAPATQGPVELAGDQIQPQEMPGHDR